MSAAERKPAKTVLYRVDELAEQPGKEGSIYKQVGDETGIKPGTIRTAALRSGRTKTGRSLHYLFTEAQEEELVLACVVHARQGIPLSMAEFRKMASYFAGKKRCRAGFNNFCQKFYRAAFGCSLQEIRKDHISNTFI